MKKKGAAVIVSLALVIASVLPHTLAVYAGQDAGAVSGGIEVSVPEESVPEEPVCICDPQPADGEAHGEDCPLCEPAEGPDYEALYQRLMAAQAEEELDGVLAGFSEEELAAFEAWLTENGLTEELEEHLAALLPESEPVEPSAVSYTDVGPLLPLPAPLRAGMLKAPAKDGADTGVVLNKEAVAVDGGYKITLEAYATGESSTSTVIQPVDIVLVLDVSGSMDDPMTAYRAVYELDTSASYYIRENVQYTEIKYCAGHHILSKNRHSAGWIPSELDSIGTEHRDYIDSYGSIIPKTGLDDADESHVQFYERYSPKKIDALKTAVNSFIDSVNEKSPESQIAIVKFSGNKSERIGNDTYRDGRYTYNYSQIVKNLTPASSNVALKDAINALSPAGATAADYGMQHAQTIIADAANDGRKKVVIMFTDGEPNHQSGFDPNVANTAISASQAIKAAGATVYTIGVFAGADGTPVDVNNLSDRTNKYMHLVSSNYKEATSMDDTGAATYPTGGKSYFLSAGSSVDLNDIFHQISQEIGGSTIKLDSNSYLLDTVTPQFTMPENASVKFYTMNCNGKDSFDESSKTPATGVTYTIDGNTLKVTGFDFSENWCGSHNGKYEGKKLIVEFTVKERDGFLGGNEVITNVGTDDGIYDKDNKNYGTFPPPTVDVPIQDVNVTAENKNVYLKGEITADQLKEGATVTVGGIPLDLLTKENYGLEPWQTAYVNITVTVKDKDGNVVTDRLANLTADTAPYTIDVTVAPKDTGTVKEKSGSGSADIHVFKPELTFQDSTAYYGESIPANNDYSGNLTDTVWKNGGKTSEDTGVTMLGDEPTLTLAYTPDPDKIADGKYTKQDVPVKVAVKIGDDNVTEHTTFAHKDCSGETWKGANGDPAFQVHIRTCTLTITKEGGAADEPYVFDIYKDDKKYSEVTIVGNGRAVIVELPVGNYTIKENTAWSWRYPAPTYTDPVQLKRGEDSGGITCTNKKTLDFWLNGFSVVIRNIFGKKN